MRDKFVGEAMTDPHDLDLMKVIEEPEAIVEAIFDFYESRGFQPTREEREKMLNL
jgi:predicted Rossmann-fold nucleotide-binding protein